jgi:hypothetical protein
MKMGVVRRSAAGPAGSQGLFWPVRAWAIGIVGRRKLFESGPGIVARENAIANMTSKRIGLSLYNAYQNDRS